MIFYLPARSVLVLGSRQKKLKQTIDVIKWADELTLGYSQSFESKVVLSLCTVLCLVHNNPS